MKLRLLYLKKRNDIDTSVMENPLYRVPEVSDENKYCQLSNAAAALNEVSTAYVLSLIPSGLYACAAKTDELSELVQKFELVKVSLPCMVFALQGRLF